MMAVPDHSRRYTRQFIRAETELHNDDIIIILRTQLNLWFTAALTSLIDKQPALSRCSYCEKKETVQHLLSIKPTDRLALAEGGSSSTCISGSQDGSCSDAIDRHPAAFGYATRARHDECVGLIRTAASNHGFTLVSGDCIHTQHPLAELYNEAQAAHVRHRRPDLVLHDETRHAVHIIDISYTQDSTAITENLLAAELACNLHKYDLQGMMHAEYSKSQLQPECHQNTLEFELHYSPTARYLNRYQQLRNTIAGSPWAADNGVLSASVRILPLIFGVRGYVPLATKKRLQIIFGEKELTVGRLCMAAARIALSAAVRLYKVWCSTKGSTRRE